MYSILIVSGFLLAVSAEQISLSGNGYIRYDIQNKPFNPSVNRVNLKFRTTHPSGLLIFLTGMGGDSLKLDLIQGTLRITLKKDHVTLNQILAGKKLDDNNWHTVHILRVNRLLDIKLNGNSEKTILIPGFFTELFMNRVLFIGGKERQSAGMKNQDINEDLRNFKGCLSSVIVDNKYPLAEIKTGNKDVAFSGIKVGPCFKQTFRPVQFANPQAKFEVINIPESNKDSEMHIRLQFRTFDSEGTIVFAEGKRCIFILGILGKKVFLELKQDEVLPARVEIPVDVTNGLWHGVSATITQTAIFLQVNSGARISAALPKFTNAYQCSLPSRLLIGGGAAREMKRGFVGCMNEINVNNRNINAFDIKKARLSGSVSAGCKIKDKCFPSPCHNGGRCFQTWHSYGCDCSKTTFYGKHCNVPIYKETCAGYAALGLKQNSFCLLDSDGTGQLPPYTTACNITKEQEIITVVSHDRAKKMNITDGTDVIRGSHFHIMNYDLPMEQIEALIKKSKACRQFLKFDCYNAALLNSPNGPPNAMWQTRTGEVKSYWGGVPDDGAGCKCGLTKSCEEKSKLCNCDSLNNKWVEDSGYVTQKDLLPVSRLHFTGIHHGFGYITLGPLECFGTMDKMEQEERPPSKILSKVCMTQSTKKYITANDTQLVWETPVKKSEKAKKITHKSHLDTATEIVSTKPGITKIADKEKKASRVNSQSAKYLLTSSGFTKIPITTIKEHSSVSSAVGNDSLKYIKRKRGAPAGLVENASIERQLSILEIVLIIFAALAISVLLIKFVLMKTIDFFRRRYQIKRLHNNECRNSNESAQALRGEQSDIVLKKIGPRKGMGAYWV